MLDPQNTPHTSPRELWDDFVNTCKKIDRFITALDCISKYYKKIIWISLVFVCN